MKGKDSDTPKRKILKRPKKEESESEEMVDSELESEVDSQNDLDILCMFTIIVYYYNKESIKITDHVIVDKVFSFKEWEETFYKYADRLEESKEKHIKKISIKKMEILFN